MATAPSHIVVVYLENENYSDIVGNTAEAPFLNQLISEGMLFTNSNGLTHPSQDNYIALFSGSTQGAVLNNVPSQYPASVPTLASALAEKGYTFGGYAETGADPQRTPWLDFANSAADGYNFSAFPQTAADFANLPTVSFITPNDADNMTPISDTGGGIAAGDAWMQANLSAYAAWAQANNSLLIITFDENNTNPAVTYPNHIATIVVGGGVPAGTTNNSPINQYSLLSTIESLYGLTPVGISGGAAPLDFYDPTTPTVPTAYTDPFSGISDPSNTPPQNALAVSPAYIVMAETTHYEVTDLSGNPIVANGSLYSLFSPLGGTLDNNLLDARAAYDSSTGRFVIVADNTQPGGGNFGTNIDIAVSKDSNPADGWFVASIDTSSGGATQSDMPYLSVINGNIYISTPEYLDAGGGYNNGEFVVSESAVTAAGNSAITPAASNIAPGTTGIMRNVAGDNGTTYYLSTYSDQRETVLTYQTYNATSGFSGTQTIFLGDADVGGSGSDYTAPQQGTTKTLDIGDSRLQSVAYASYGGHNYVYGVSEAMPSAGSAAEIEWFQLDVTNPANPQFVNGNVISGASIGTNVAVFNPSIAVDANGDVLINFSASGPNMYPSDYYTVLGAGTSAFSAPTLYQASNTFFDSGTLNDQRWGTYSTAVADPDNPGSFWLSSEYISGGTWQTAVAQVQVNQGPTLTAGATTTFTGGGPSVTLDGTLTLIDPSSTTIASATVSIGSFLSGDTLNFTNQNGITGSYNSATGVLTLSGTASAANYQAALDSITYGFSANGDPTGGGTHTTRTIDWVVNDGMASSNTATSTLDMTHGGPTVTAAGATATFTGGGTAVALDGGLTLSDPDSGGNLTSATVSIGTGFLAGDTLSFTNQNGISGSYNAATGVLTLTGTSSVANYQAALDSITYSFSANGDPTGGGTHTTRTIDWVVNDGVASSNTATSTLDTTHVAPTVSAGATATFTGGGTAVALDGGLTLSDPDSGGNLTSATVSIGTGFLAGDTLSFTNQNGISGSYNAATGVLTLTGTSSVANYQAALASITYSFSANGDPTGGGTHTTRTIDWVVNDGVASSNTATSTLDTTHVAPTVTAGATATFTGGGTAVALDGGLTLSDPDSGGNLTSATVSIGTGFLAGDTLSFTNQNGISGSYNAATGVLTLTGTSSVANYQAALASITYNFNPAGGDPTAGGGDAGRTIDWVINDGVANSNTATSTLVMPTASALVQGGNGALDYLEFAGAQLVASDLVSFGSWPVVAEGDFNHDGQTELVSQDQKSGRIDLLSVNNGVLQASLLEEGSYWNVVGAGDFDGSGRTGIATQNATTGQIDLLWFTGAQLTSSEMLNGSYQHVVGAADFNGDGKTDLITQEPTTGTLDFLFFSNTNLVASALTPDSYWPVHDVLNSGDAGQTRMVSQDPASGQLDYLNFNGTAIASSLLESGAFPGLTAVQGTEAAVQFFKSLA